MNWILPATVAALLLAFPAAAQQKIDPAKSSIRFVTKQMNVPVEGQFKRFDATVAFDPAKPEATKAEFEVDLGSIDLGSDGGRDRGEAQDVARRRRISEGEVRRRAR